MVVGAASCYVDRVLRLKRPPPPQEGCVRRRLDEDGRKPRGDVLFV